MKPFNDVTVNLQVVLVKRWAEGSWNFRYYNKIISATLRKYKDQIFDNISHRNVMFELLKNRGSIDV